MSTEATPELSRAMSTLGINNDTPILSPSGVGVGGQNTNQNPQTYPSIASPRLETPPTEPATFAEYGQQVYYTPAPNHLYLDNTGGGGAFSPIIAANNQYPYSPNEQQHHHHHHHHLPNLSGNIQGYEYTQNHIGLSSPLTGFGNAPLGLGINNALAPQTQNHNNQQQQQQQNIPSSGPGPRRYGNNTERVGRGRGGGYFGPGRGALGGAGGTGQTGEHFGYGQDGRPYWMTQQGMFVQRDGKKLNENFRHNQPSPSYGNNKSFNPRNTHSYASIARNNSSNSPGNNNHYNNNNTTTVSPGGHLHHTNQIHGSHGIATPAHTPYNTQPPSQFGMHYGSPPSGANPYNWSGATGYVPMGGYYGGGGGGSLMNGARFRNPMVANSALLEDFKLNKLNKRWEFHDIRGYMSEFAGDQNGSRFIQQRLETASLEEKKMLLDEILPNAYALMTDVFGNYIFQKLFEQGDQLQKAAIARELEGKVLSLSMQMYGCRVVQKAIEHVLIDQRKKLISELDGHIVECVKSANANHVIQKILVLGPPQSIPDAMIGHVEELCCNPNGCRVLQKVFECLPESMTRKLLDELHGCSERLIMDQFGNYVIQSIITHGEDADRSKLIVKVKARMIEHCRHKFASNVVEKALNHSNPDDRRDLIEAIMAIAPDGKGKVAVLLRDAYGNFPVQTALACGEDTQRQRLINIVVPILSSIRHTPVGKRLSYRVGELEKEGFTIPPRTYYRYSSTAKPAVTTDSAEDSSPTVVSSSDDQESSAIEDGESEDMTAANHLGSSTTSVAPTDSSSSEATPTEATPTEAGKKVQGGQGGVVQNTLRATASAPPGALVGVAGMKDKGKGKKDGN